MLPGWKGAILKHTDILEAGSADEQYEIVKSFYRLGFNMLLDRLKSN